MKTEIMKLTNRLIELLEYCDEEEFVDEVCANINYATPFDEEFEEVW